MPSAQVISNKLLAGVRFHIQLPPSTPIVSTGFFTITTTSTAAQIRSRHSLSRRHLLST
jgi:hypothetical protein